VPLTSLSPGPRDTSYRRLEMACSSVTVPWDRHPELPPAPKSWFSWFRHIGRADWRKFAFPLYIYI